MPGPAVDLLPAADAIRLVPPGRWGVAVSGGADSVALLRLAAARGDLAPHVVHLDHQARGADSSADADFVCRLARDLRLPYTLATLAKIESTFAVGSAGATPDEFNESPEPRSHDRTSTGVNAAAAAAAATTAAVAAAGRPSNPSARYRAARLALYRRAVAAHGLAGVLLAHHADDQAETVLLRLIRGAGYPGLAGMAGDARVAGVRLVRPLLRTRPNDLRAHLRALGQPWREDASNASDDYARNRVRRALPDRPDLVSALLQVAAACRTAAGWVGANAPALPPAFDAAAVADLPDALAGTAVAAWLRRRGVPPDAVSPVHVSAVVRMCRDAAAPARHAAPGRVTVCRRRGRVTAE